MMDGGACEIVDLALIVRSGDDGAAGSLVLQGAAPAIIYNSMPGPVSITIPTNPSSVYTIPPKSTFSLSHITPLTASSFSATLLALTNPQTTHSDLPLSSKFNLIILDPPWHNKSVTRSRQYSTQRDDPLSCLRPVLGLHIAGNGLVACWITNKASARAEALECFRVWGVRLIEEWVWLKITIKGEPVYNVEGVWKKPFEVLLVGRKMGHEDVGSRNSKGNTGSEVEHGKNNVAEVEGGVKRRLIVGVPDLHSRKPSLRRLMEPVVGKGEEYRALEVFTRSLTAGWVAWGDEVLKFNWEGYWTHVENDNGQYA